MKVSTLHSMKNSLAGKTDRKVILQLITNLTSPSASIVRNWKCGLLRSGRYGFKDCKKSV